MGLRRLDPGEEESPAARDCRTTADRDVEAPICESLRTAFPDCRIEGEDVGARQGGDPDAPLAVIDPIGGTAISAWGSPRYGMVITVVQGGEIVTGAVKDPMMAEMFTAARGRGAALNGVPLRVSTKALTEHMFFGAALPVPVPVPMPVPGQVVSVTEARYRDALAHAMTLSLSSAQVAAGRCDEFLEAAGGKVRPRITG